MGFLAHRGSMVNEEYAVLEAATVARMRRTRSHPQIEQCIARFHRLLTAMDQELAADTKNQPRPSWTVDDAIRFHMDSLEKAGNDSEDCE